MKRGASPLGRVLKEVAYSPQLRIDKTSEHKPIFAGTDRTLMLVVLPLHIQAGQSGDIKSSVTAPVRTLSAGKYIRISLDTLEREAKFFSDASAGLITT
jgi:hypothetical protein